MSMRKRKFSNTSLTRSASTKCRSPNTAAAASMASSPSKPLNDLYQNFVLNVVDQAVLASPDVPEFRCPTTAIPAVLQSSHAVEETSKSVTSQVSQPIPLPPPVPESSLKAAGILAELISLRGSHLTGSTVDSSNKARKSSFDKFAERSVQGIVHGPLVSPVVSFLYWSSKRARVVARSNL